MASPLVISTDATLSQTLSTKMGTILQYLPHITVGMWLMMITGYLLVPDFILQPLVKFPLVILITIFLTVSFWILHKAGKRGLALLFIGIFLFNVWMPVYASILNNEWVKSIDQDTGKGIAPELAELLCLGDTAEEREMTAKIIFTRHGISLPYKAADDSFIAYSPTKADKDQYIISNEQHIQAVMATTNLKGQIEASNFLVGLQLALFLILLIFLLLYDRPCTQSAQNQDWIT